MRKKNSKVDLKQLKKLQEELELEKGVSAKLRKQLDSVCSIANNMATTIKKDFKDKKEELVQLGNAENIKLIEEYEIQIHLLTDENEKLKAEVVSLQNNIKTLESKVEEHKTYIHHTMRLEKDFRNEKEELVPSYETENVNLKAKVVSLQECIKKLEIKIDEYKAHIWSLRKR